MTLDAKRDEVDMGTMMERIVDELGECRPKVDVDAKPLGATGVLGDILRWLTRAGFDRKLADPAPREIIRNITIEALVQAAPWGGGGLEFPNDYTVVVSEQMEHGVNRQKGHFALQAVAVHFGLLHGALHRNNNITKHRGAGFLVDVIMIVFAQRKA